VTRRIKFANVSRNSAKRLVAAWRVLVGVWAPKHWDLSLSALTQYTIPRVPQESAWIDKPRSGSTTPRPASPAGPSPASAPANGVTASPAAPKPKKHKRPPSRQLVRHVLRARTEAAKALAGLFVHLERAGDSKRVRASSHLARAHRSTVDADAPVPGSATGKGVGEAEEPRGWRSAREVVSFLRDRGAKITQLREKVAGEWAALSSEGEPENTDVDSGLEDLVFVPSSSSLSLGRKAA
jgi:glycerol-3-phosphate O-acyltransferase / dihydroxyacetone phosphate acyltransferase